MGPRLSAAVATHPEAPLNESFLLLFSKKEVLACLAIDATSRFSA
jgi:hypothetical protein